jgi:two-component system, cell cycle sensor histidine kinase and response regulator CckA
MPLPYRVLLVEDDPGHAQIVQDYFSLAESFLVEWVDCVEDLWVELKQGGYDVVLLDFRLPDGNGLDALVEISARGYDLPVLMVTARGDERVAAEAIRLGAADYIVKQSDYFMALPAAIYRALETHELKKSIQASWKKIRYQAMILENVPDAVVVWDVEGRITFWNSAAVSLFGWYAAERLGEHVSESYFPMFSPALGWPIKTFDLNEVERAVTTRNGKIIWVSSRVTALWDESKKGHLIGTMDVVRDMTERKAMISKIELAQTRLAEKARLASVGELASGIAHRINNPLTTIIAESQIMLRSFSANHEWRESIEAVEQSGWAAQQVIQRLIEFSQPVLSLDEWVQVNSTIEHANVLVGAQIESVGIALEVDLQDSLPKVFGDAARLEDLWVTLLLQGRDLARSNNTKVIQIRTASQPGERVLVEVGVPGVSIPPARLPTIFEPDFNAPLGGHGTGLELSRCREIALQLRGEIAALNEDNKVVFRVLLPISAPGLEEDEQG